MNAAGKGGLQGLVDEAMALDTAASAEVRRDDSHSEMALTAFAMTGVAGMSGRFVQHHQAFGCKRGLETGFNQILDG